MSEETSLSCQASAVANGPISQAQIGSRWPPLPLRIEFFLSGVLIPAALFFFVFFADGPPTLRSLWQSGKIEVFLACLLKPEAFLVFLPLFFWSMISLTAWLLDPRAISFSFIRTGIYGGVILAIANCLIVVLIGSILPLLAAVLVMPVLRFGCYLATGFLPTIRRFGIRHLLILMAFSALVLAIREALAVFLLPSLSAAGMVVAVAAPLLSAISYCRVASHFWRESVRVGWRDPLVLPAIWLLAWGISWKESIDAMFDQYQRLPVTDPNCFVSSAAAHGHSWLVRSKPVSAGGTLVWISPQMQRLKALELIFVVTCPTFHRYIRRVYNRVGPVLAGVIRTKIVFADIAWLILLPIEAVACLALVAAGINGERIRRLYQSDGQGQSFVFRMAVGNASETPAFGNFRPMGPGRSPLTEWD